MMIRHGIRRFSSGVFPNDKGSAYILKEGWSHVKGPSEPALIRKGLGEFFQDVCQLHGSHEALVVSDGAEVLIRHTYNSLNEKVDQLARGLLRLGIKKGDRVGVWLPNSEEWVLAQFATAKVGAILVSLNPAYKKRELLHAMKLVEMKAIITLPSLSSSNYLGILQEIFPELGKQSDPRERVKNDMLPFMEHIIMVSNQEPGSNLLNFSSLLEKDGNMELEDIQDTDPINIQFTSGTTGKAKGALLSSLTVINNGRYVGDCLKLKPTDRANICVPLFHCFGMVLGNIACISHGSTMVYPAKMFSPSKTLASIEAEKCTAAYGVPTMFSAELHDPDFEKYDLSTLRTGIMAGSTCPIELMNQVTQKMNLKEMTIAYGMTETGPVSFQSRTDCSIELRCETVGRIMPNTECKVVDNEGNTVPIGTPGELYTRGYLVMNGYYNDKETTKSCLTEDGWMKTGDLTTLDKEGYLRVVGRIKDVVIRGGENIFPRELEELISEIPNVVNVQIVGVPDEVYGEQICAVVVKKGDLSKEDILEYCRANVSHQKIPAHLLFRESLDEFLTLSGKVQKFKLREWAIHQISA